jgi:hypothetical protein
VEQAGGGWRAHQGGDLGATARLAEDQDARRIAAEGRNVVADPSQGEDEIQLAEIAAVGEPRIDPGEVEVS